MPIIVTTGSQSTALLDATGEATNAPPRMRLTVNAASTSGAYDAIITRTSALASGVVIRQANPLLLQGGVGLTYDYEVPYGIDATYTVTIRNSAGATLTTGSDTGRVDSLTPWLIHPGVPSLSLQVPLVQSLGDRVRKVSQGVHEPIGRALPLVVTDGRRKAPTSTLMVRTRTLLELDRLNALLDDTSPLLFNVPATLGWGLTAEYIAVGDSNEARELGIGADPYRLWTFPYIVVASPVGNVQAQRTWSNVIAESTTWQQVLDQHTTWLDLLAPGA